jgi:hypothetical protein
MRKAWQSRRIYTRLSPYQNDTVVLCTEHRRVVIQTERAEHTQVRTYRCRIILQPGRSHCNHNRE